MTVRGGITASSVSKRKSHEGMPEYRRDAAFAETRSKPCDLGQPVSVTHTSTVRFRVNSGNSFRTIFRFAVKHLLFAMHWRLAMGSSPLETREPHCGEDEIRGVIAENMEYTTFWVQFRVQFRSSRCGKDVGIFKMASAVNDGSVFAENINNQGPTVSEKI